MLTFIDKNEVYSGRKFDEVSKKKRERYSLNATQFHLFLWICFYIQ